jgi:hypothetical protein
MVLTASGGTGAFGGATVIASVDSATQLTITSTTANTAGALNFNVGGATDVTANGAGLTVLGTTNKTIIWDNTNSNWTSSEHWNIASSKAFKINNTSVLNATTLGSGVTGSSLTSVGTISTGTWQGTTIGTIYGGTGLVEYTSGDILYASASNTLSRLAKGTDGQVLKLASGFPSWAADNNTDTVTRVGVGTTVGVSGDVQLVQGTNVSISRDGQNITIGSSVPTSITVTSITTGSETTAGTITGAWSLTGKFQATYADLAENYEADEDYDPGTVVELGGEKEVTLAEDSTCRVAGVVSTNPAYLLNKECPGKHVVAIALQGRVPVKVRGRVRKGDFLVSGGNGFARPSSNPVYGSVIGKAIENFDGIEGVIEVMIGRM